MPEPEREYKAEATGAAALVLVAFALLTAACHGFPDFRHAVSIHSNLDYEDYCWDTSGSSVIDNAEAEYMLAGTLFPGPEHEDEAWPGLDSAYGLNPLWFIPMGTCGVHSDLTAAFIQYTFVNDTNLPGYCGGYSCVGHFNQTCSGDHCNYRHEHVNLRDQTMSGTTAVVLHTINHETGHVLGLLDPIEPYDAIGWNHCRAELIPGIVHWVDSIMHAPPSYCFGYAPQAVYSWPRPWDRDGVKLIMQDSSVETICVQQCE